MGAVGGILIAIGGLVMLVGGIMMLIAAFKESVMWGVLALLVPFAMLVFVIMHFQAAKKGFFIWLAGFPLYLIGVGLLMASFAGQMSEMNTDGDGSGMEVEE